jgi:hypothetical protein
LPAASIEPLQNVAKFYVWDHMINQVRWMCSWDTTQEDVDFALNMKSRGFDTYYDPSITVFHLENASSDANFAQEQININWKVEIRNKILI